MKISAPLLGLATALCFVAGTAHAQTVVVTPSNPAGWAQDISGDPLGSVTITNTYPRSGNGSAQMHLNDALNGEADWVKSTGINAQIRLLDNVSYDWYRSSTSTMNGIIAPTFAMHLLGGGYLVYEPYYTNLSLTQVVDSWVHEDALAGNWWFTGNNVNTTTCIQYGAFSTLSFFNSTCLGGNGTVDGTTMFVGSSYAGTFDGAVDNVTIGVSDNDPTTWNFETESTVTPEPGSIALVAAGLAGVAVMRRRKRRA